MTYHSKLVEVVDWVGVVEVDHLSSSVRARLLEDRMRDHGCAALEEQDFAVYLHLLPKPNGVPQYIAIDAMRKPRTSYRLDRCRAPRRERKNKMSSKNPKIALKNELAPLEIENRGGGEACVEMLSSVLDHALDVLEQLSASTPRKARRSMRDVCDRVEAVLESMDAEWCDGVSLCGHDELGRLSGLVVCVRGLSPSSLSLIHI